MLRLRPYKPCDAEIITNWCKDELTMRKWTSDRYEKFPITAEDMNHKYIECNGDCDDADNFYPMTAFDENGLVGHMIMRFLDKEKKTLRFGFVILNDEIRGKGYGKAMIKLAIRYAFDILKVDKITMGAFDCNMAAYYCYKAAGFKDANVQPEHFYSYHDEKWSFLELEIDRADYERGSNE